jgi:hypothetical protein
MAEAAECPADQGCVRACACAHCWWRGPSCRYKQAHGLKPTVPPGGAEWGREMIDAWATALAGKVDVACGRKTLEQVVGEQQAVEAAGTGAGVGAAWVAAKARL